MRVLAACSLGGAGHLNPLVPFLEAARRRGDETLVVGPPALAELVGHAGFDFRAGGAPSEAEVAPIRELLPVVSAEEASILGNRELFGRLAAPAMLSALDRVCRDWAPDVIVREPCEFASAAAARRHGIPVAQVAISAAEAEESSIRAAEPALDELAPGLADDLRAAPYLTRFPASLDPSPFPTTIRFREGRPAEGGDEVPAPLSDWWGGSDAPLVYVTFGTVLGHMTTAGQVLRAAVAAVASLDVRVLLTVGRAFDPADLGPMPPSVHVERWVDQARVVRSADLVLCHGGSGTVYGAMAAGVPVVTVPMFADQFENGRRIASAGAGLTVEVDGGSRRRVVDATDAAVLTEAVGTVLGADRFRERACAIAAEMASAPSVDDVLAAILRR